MAKQGTRELFYKEKNFTWKRGLNQLPSIHSLQQRKKPIPLDDEDTHPTGNNFKSTKGPKAKAQALLRTPSPEPSHKGNNDPIELDVLSEGHKKFSISLEGEKGDDGVFEDVHQSAKKHNHGTPRTPRIVIHGPSKRGFDEYEGIEWSSRRVYC